MSRAGSPAHTPPALRARLRSGNATKANRPSSERHQRRACGTAHLSPRAVADCTHRMREPMHHGHVDTAPTGMMRSDIKRNPSSQRARGTARVSPRAMAGCRHRMREPVHHGRVVATPTGMMRSDIKRNPSSQRARGTARVSPRAMAGCRHRMREPVHHGRVVATPTGMMRSDIKRNPSFERRSKEGRQYLKTSPRGFEPRFYD